MKLSLFSSIKSFFSWKFFLSIIFILLYFKLLFSDSFIELNDIPFRKPIIPLVLLKYGFWFFNWFSLLIIFGNFLLFSSLLLLLLFSLSFI
jgi:hypothetical protein